VRAQQLTGDAWSEDPGCYLLDEEIGVDSQGLAPVAVGGFAKRFPLEVIRA
jgi:hypothetical protein